MVSTRQMACEVFSAVVGRNNPGKEAEFSGSGAWGWGAAAAARGPEVFTQLPFTLGSEGTTEREGCKKNLKYSKKHSVSKL